MSAKENLRGDTAFFLRRNEELKRPLCRFSMLSFCRLISEGEMKRQAAGAVLKRERGGVCPFVVSRLACASRAPAHAYYKGLKKTMGLKFKGKSILFSFRKERTKGQKEIKAESLKFKESGLRGDCAFVLSQNSNENKGQKDKFLPGAKTAKDDGLGLRGNAAFCHGQNEEMTRRESRFTSVAGAVLVWIYAGIFGLVFWSVLFACWQLGGAL